MSLFKEANPSRGLMKTRLVFLCAFLFMGGCGEKSEEAAERVLVQKEETSECRLRFKAREQEVAFLISRLEADSGGSRFKINDKIQELQEQTTVARLALEALTIAGPDEQEKKKADFDTALNNLKKTIERQKKPR